jgi:hypothetical protein
VGGGYSEAGTGYDGFYEKRGAPGTAILRSMRGNVRVLHCGS